MSKRIVAVILARGGSKGIPKKNIIDFCGKPLISWSISHIVQLIKLMRFMPVSTVRRLLTFQFHMGRLPLGVMKNFLPRQRPLVIVGALSQIEKVTSVVDLVVFLQATSPLREPVDTDNSIRVLQNNEADSLFSAPVLEDFFIWEYQDNLLTSVNYDHERYLRSQGVKP